MWYENSSTNRLIHTEAQPQPHPTLLWASLALAALGVVTLLIGAFVQDPVKSIQNSIAMVPAARVMNMPVATPGVMKHWGTPSHVAERSRVVTAATADASSGGDSSVVEIAGEEFDKRTKSDINSGDLPVMIDYHAAWCGPCKIMNPKFMDLAAEYKGKVVSYKIDCGQYGEKCKEMGIKQLPTFHLYKNGMMVAEAFGTDTVKLEKMFKNSGMY
jgi:thioredoxin 1|uniref:Thioredoxin domain-containing protein n=1 Tax=Eutreptiella gymnastica TaxID=73025 RepID=A0A7S4LM09_9EUGL|eukprot:CAMPEP_0174293816 /NCGR_PEP_ID=MMETSP0809-20121228/39789_1 /TAXON_ID=73025 ORGANISM="Eutreptiella gymnastica-like, Strain CCMP1594" /NCGR_SAMPLE_ID=MMETSP0809 /ASSEMBLY_ACC=CAM_ASM_000658 /LENGTH=214 /DNA_ID=CAMNT_0015394873 /DNA_START=42 /DNA_END=686 /DNA_ORIENTATION=-